MERTPRPKSSPSCSTSADEPSTSVVSDPPAPYIDEPDKVPSDARLIRRVSPEHVDWDGDRVGNRLRVTKQAIQMLSQELALKFGCPGPGMSLIAEHLSTSLEDLVSRYHDDEGYGLAYLDGNLLRVAGERGIQHRPTESEPAHVVMFRLDGGKKLSPSLREQLADHATANWIVEPRPR